jgi:hypothetical protein
VGNQTVLFVITWRIEIIFSILVLRQEWCGVLWVQCWGLTDARLVLGNPGLGSMLSGLVERSFILWCLQLFVGPFGLLETR